MILVLRRGTSGLDRVWVGTVAPLCACAQRSTHQTGGSGGREGGREVTGIHGASHSHSTGVFHVFLSTMHFRLSIIIRCVCVSRSSLSSSPSTSTASRSELRVSPSVRLSVSVCPCLWSLSPGSDPRLCPPGCS